MTDLERLDAIFTLTPEQQSHVDSLLWLFRDEERGQGRTHLLMYIIMRIALEHPGSVKYFMDHSSRNTPGQQGTDALNMLEALLLRDTGLSNRTFLDLKTSGRVAVAIREKRCIHCHKPESQHHGETKKCLFDSTQFESND